MTMAKEKELINKKKPKILYKFLKPEQMNMAK